MPRNTDNSELATRNSQLSNTVLIADAAWCELQKRAPGLTIDKALCRPMKLMVPIVKAVRQQFPGTPEEVICESLLNARKKGQFASGSRRRH